MNATQYPILIHKHLTGEITPEEKLELDRWLQEDEANRTLRDRYTRIWQTSGATPVTSRKQQQRARLLERVHHDVQEAGLNRIQIHRMAAGLVFLVASTLVIAYFMNNRTVTIRAHVKQSVWLDERSRIILQPQAVLAFQYSSSHELMASFNGEGLFEFVQRAAITLPNATIHADTSSFFINCKPGGPVQIEVLSGEVTVTTRSGKVVLHANQHGIVNQAGVQVSRLHAQGS